MEGIFTLTNIILGLMLVIVWSFCIKVVGLLEEINKNASLTDAEKRKER